MKVNGLNLNNMRLNTKEFKIKKLQKAIRICSRCRLSETRIHALPGEGCLDARIMLIAQAPGENEDKKGRMFIGPSGKILDELLAGIGVDRDSLYMTNLVKCMLPRYRKPKQDEIDACSIYLDREIEIVNPEILIPLGFYSTTYIFKKYNISIPRKDDFYKVYGKLFLSDDMRILPLQHPAAILHRPELREILINSYHKLKVLSKTCKWYTVCPMKRFYEQGVLDSRWIKLYCKGDWESCIRYQMEENGEYHPDYMLPDGTIDDRLKNLA